MYLVPFSQNCSFLSSVEKPKIEIQRTTFFFVWVYNSVSGAEGRTCTDVSVAVVKKIFVPEIEVTKDCICGFCNDALNS